MAYTNPLHIANGLTLDFAVAAATPASDSFLGVDATGELSKFTSVPASRVSAGGNLTEATSAVLTITGGTGAVLSGLTIQVKLSGAEQSGYLSTTDWNIFNNKLGTSLTSAFLFVGSAGNIATGVAMTGDIAITNAGVTSIGAGKILNAQINAFAAIAQSKMAALTPSLVMATDGSGFTTTVAGFTTTIAGYLTTLTGDITSLLAGKLSATITTPSSGQIISYDGIAWVNTSPATGVPTGGSAGQYLNKIDATNYNTQWSTLTLSKVTDISALAADVNVLTGISAFGITTAEIETLNGVSSSIQSQLDAITLRSPGLNSGYLWVGQVGGNALPLAPGSNNQVFTIVGGLPAWSTSSTSGHVIQNNTTPLTSRAALNFSTGLTATDNPGNNATDITLTSPVTEILGGTGQTVYAIGDILYASTTTALSKLADVAAGSLLRSGGVSTAPVWSTTTYPNSATTGDLLYASAANVYSNLGAGTINYVLTSNGAGVAPSWQVGGSVAAWLLASGGTLTGANTISGAFDLTFTNNSINQTQPALLSAWVPAITLTPGAHTGLLANTEFINYAWGGPSTITQTWLTGTVATQRDHVFRPITHSGANPTVFIDLYNVWVDNPLISGAGVTATRSWAAGFGGSVNVRLDQNAATYLIVQNQTNTAASESRLAVSNGGSTIASLSTYPSNFTSSGLRVANSAALIASISGGLNIGVDNAFAGAQVSLWTNNIKRLGISLQGNFTFTSNAQSTAWAPAITVTPGAHTLMATLTEFPDFVFAGSNHTWVAGTIPQQRFAWFKASTITTGLATDAFTAYFDAPLGNFTKAWGIGTAGNLLVGGLIGTAGSVLADFQSTTLGVMMPRVTAIASVATPVAGMIAYDATTNKFNFRESAAWVQLGGGGITNGAVANEMMKSDGTNAVASGIFSTVAGNLTFGTGLTGATRTITLDGSAADVGAAITTKGAGVVIISTGDGLSNLSFGTISSYTLRIDRTDASTNTVLNLLTLLRQSSGTPAVGIGASFEFFVETAASNFEIGAKIGAVTTNVGAGTEAFDLVFNTMTGGAIATEKLRIDSNGNIGIGTSAFGTSAATVLAITNGTAPTTSPANAIQLYAEDVSASSELKVRDEAGNVTTLSPHNFTLIGEPSEEMAWAYYSERNGKKINVDMLKLARLVEKLTGDKLVYTV